MSQKKSHLVKKTTIMPGPRKSKEKKKNRKKKEKRQRHYPKKKQRYYLRKKKRQLDKAHVHVHIGIFVNKEKMHPHSVFSPFWGENILVGSRRKLTPKVVQ